MLYVSVEFDVDLSEFNSILLNMENPTLIILDVGYNLVLGNIDSMFASLMVALPRSLCFSKVIGKAGYVLKLYSV